MVRLLGRSIAVVAVVACVAGGGIVVTPGSASASTVFQTTLPFSNLSFPQQVAVDATGDVFVADYQNDRVLELPDGGTQETLPFTGLDGPAGVAVDGGGDVFVSEFGNGRVVELTTGGKQVTLPFEVLDQPAAIAVDGSGDVFVAEGLVGQVTELPAGGGQQVALPFTGLGDPAGLAVDGRGDVFVTDEVHDAVVELPISGSQVTLPLTGLSSPAGVAVDASGDVFATDADNHRVVELPNGEDQVTLPFTGLDRPVGVAVDEAGNVVVGDAGANRVVVGVAPLTVPQSPVLVTGVGGNESAQVSWVPYTTPGSDVTGYTVTPSVGGVAQPGQTFGSPATSETVTGLTNGVAYRFDVAATNAYGTGPETAPSSVVIPPFASPTAFTQRQYHDFVGTAPAASAVADELAALESGAAPGAYASALRRSTDATTNVDPVTRPYFAYFGRIPDAGGLTYWIGRRRAGASVFAISDAFALSPEFKHTYGSLSNGAFVGLVYRNVLGRAPDIAGYTYWVTQLDGHHVTRGQAMVGFSESGEYTAAKQPAVDVVVTWIDLLGVSPSTANFTTWVTDLTTGDKSVTDLAQALMAMPAYAARVG